MIVNPDTFKEISILTCSSHPIILHMYDYGILHGRTWILLEYADLGILNTYVENHSYLSEKALLHCYVAVI